MPERREQPADVPLLREMGEELHRLFLAQERGRALPGMRSRRGFAAFNARVIVALVALLLVAAAVALADGLLSGAPVTPPYRTQPTKDDGAPIGASATLLALSVPDPAGGLPWGLRMLSTTRGVGCLQYGRLYDGQLGVLGEDGAFGDDHRFHALSAQDAVFGSDGCAPLDAGGRLFMAVQSQAVPASAYPQGCIPRVDHDQGARDPGDPGLALCPIKDGRALFYGALGPDVESIAYSLRTHSETVREPGRYRDFTITRSVYAFDGPTVTVPTVGPQGAYLIVAEQLPGAPSDTFGPGAPNGSATLPRGLYQPIRAITYRDGVVCHIGATLDRDNRGRPCTPIGMVALTRPAPAQVRAPLSARILYDHRDPPLRPEDVVRVSFVARAPITSAASYYAIAMRFPCRGGSGGSTIDEDVPAGRRLTFTLGMSAGPPGSKPCPGVYSGEVLYGDRSTHLPFLGGGLVVGRFSVRLP
ncbi:MAG: hypothetical protein ACLPUT_00195 [Solirubrobacteraceae bacterium]